VGEGAEVVLQEDTGEDVEHAHHAVPGVYVDAFAVGVDGERVDRHAAQLAHQEFALQAPVVAAATLMPAQHCALAVSRVQHRAAGVKTHARHETLMSVQLLPKLKKY